MIEEESPPQFVAVIEWQIQTKWFELDSRTRLDYARQLRDIVAKFPKVRFRWFDAEAWTGKFTDFTLCEFEDLDSYNSLWGELRRHAFLSTPFAFVSRVTMGMQMAMDLEGPEPSACAQLAAEDGAVLAAGCPSCGRPLRSNVRFCGDCGNAVQPESPSAPSGMV